MPRAERLMALLEDPQYADGRSECRLALALGLSHSAVGVHASAAGARPFMMADGRFGWTLRPEPTPNVREERPEVVFDYGAGRTV